MSNDKEPWSWPSGRSAQRRYRKGLQFSTEDVTANHSALGKVVHVCHLKTNLDVKRVITCGSVGKGTPSTDSADLDLVVYINDLTPEDIQNRLSAILDAIERAMDEQYPGTRDKEWYRKFGLTIILVVWRLIFW
jgi:hypothetical protein